jgi:hypothetical protein
MIMPAITVEDFKAHANVTLAADDVLIADKIAAAEAWIGAFVGKPLAEFDPLPEPIKEAVRQLVAHLYENREATLVGVNITDVSPGLFDLLAPYREYVF